MVASGLVRRQRLAQDHLLRQPVGKRHAPAARQRQRLSLGVGHRRQPALLLPPAPRRLAGDGNGRVLGHDPLQLPRAITQIPIEHIMNLL
jgi:hypothetical protein